MNVLVTGGGGYIGSHAAMKLLEDGHNVTIVDDLSRGHIGAIFALEEIGDLYFAKLNFGDVFAMAELLKNRSIDVVMHFAALTYVGESVEQPIRYYENNTANAISLFNAMQDAGVKRIVFSSTAATYGIPSQENIPITEDCPQIPINPYGWSKLMVERVLKDQLTASQSKGEDFAFAALRYFNVAGCDPQSRLGEHHEPETHLIPICLDVALGKVDAVTVFGNDYQTPDGTCVRDYVHIDDLVDAHIVVMESLTNGDGKTYNIGIGKGYSVSEIVDACKEVTGIDFEVRSGSRRSGDPPILCANASKIKDALNWSAKHTNINDVIESAWRWRKANPNGYA